MADIQPVAPAGNADPTNLHVRRSSVSHRPAPRPAGP